MLKDNWLNIQKKILFCFIFFLFSASATFAQNETIKWKINVNFASMKPSFELDRWFVTSEGYHVHPASEDYTPGLQLGIERLINKRINLELSFLYGRPPAFLGIVDQFSESGREANKTEHYNFLVISINPRLYVVKRNFGNIYASPVVGYGIQSQKTITPSFGPSVTWTRSSDLVYGVRAGMNFRLKMSNLFFNTELLILSMETKLEENQTSRQLKKTIGPAGLLLGISYAFNKK